MNRYRTTLRPAGGGGIPNGVIWRYVESPHDFPNDWMALPASRHRYGVIETARPLTAEEMKHFDIEEVT